MLMSVCMRERGVGIILEIYQQGIFISPRTYIFILLFAKTT